ncbi:hypothetical protein CDAR_70681 [Caerostris darwini]|uniref:Uncharacterized protein n=1 Tax=Caerostris darwini TaxID=1538125 RepID=A0AAV4WDU7_9ARAC|nr:hypothetical protein CDAR_70681 [Caerostris darwini]
MTVSLLLQNIISIGTHNSSLNYCISINFDGSILDGSVLLLLMLEFQMYYFFWNDGSTLDDDISTVTDVRATDGSISSGTVGGTLDGTDSIDTDDSIFSSSSVSVITDVGISVDNIFSGIADDSASVITDVGIQGDDILSISGHSLDGGFFRYVGIPDGTISYGADEVSLLISGLQLVVFF